MDGWMIGIMMAVAGLFYSFQLGLKLFLLFSFIFHISLVLISHFSLSFCVFCSINPLLYYFPLYFANSQTPPTPPSFYPYHFSFLLRKKLNVFELLFLLLMMHFTFSAFEL